MFLGALIDASHAWEFSGYRAGGSDDSALTLFENALLTAQVKGDTSKLTYIIKKNLSEEALPFILDAPMPSGTAKGWINFPLTLAYGFYAAQTDPPIRSHCFKGVNHAVALLRRSPNSHKYTTSWPQDEIPVA